MKFLKYFEGFIKPKSSQYQQLTTDEYISWRKNWSEGNEYLSFEDSEPLRSYVNELREIISIFTSSMPYTQMETMDVSSDINRKIELRIVILTIEGTGQILQIRPWENSEGQGLVISCYGPNAKFSDPSTADFHYNCKGTETDPLYSLTALMEDKYKVFQKKPKEPKIPKPYKNEPVLNDADFQGYEDRRSDFYKQFGSSIKNLSREEALTILNNWKKNSESCENTLIEIK